MRPATIRLSMVSGGKDYFAAALKVLAAHGLALPSDTTEGNLCERIVIIGEALSARIRNGAGKRAGGVDDESGLPSDHPDHPDNNRGPEEADGTPLTMMSAVSGRRKSRQEAAADELVALCLGKR